MLQQMLIMMILMAVGLVCYHKKFITDEATKMLSGLVVNVANPALVLSGGMSGERIDGSELLITFFIAIGLYAALMIIAAVIPHLLRVRQQESGIYRVMTVFSNIGFMGFPIISSVFGKGALLYTTLFLIPYNILFYTYGIYSIQKAAPGNIRTTEAGESPSLGRKVSMGKVLNVGVIAGILSLTIYLGRIPIPGVVVSGIEHLSNLTAPLSMMIIGASLGTMGIKELVTDIRLLCFSALKLLVIPVIGILVIRQVVENQVIVGVCMVVLATPVGSMTAMLAREYDGEYQFAARGVTLTTLLSMVTLPLVAAILRI